MTQNGRVKSHRFVKATEWKDEIRIDIREWEIQNDKRVPTKKGISLSLHRWKLLANNMDFVDQALDEKREYATHLGGNVYVSVKASGICVDIRQHWLPPNQEGNNVKTGRIRQIKRCGQCDL